jgi:ribonucleoside-diphosphate reductase beta chain
MQSTHTGGIFLPRQNFKPYEYPELYEYTNAIRHSYWLHTEFNYTSDIDDFKTQINDSEREAIKRTMLAISQVEVAVKGFWGDIYKHIPKAEVGAVGATFAECEVRHADAYAHLLEILGLNEDFEKVMEVPAVQKRVEYLQKAVSDAKSDNPKDYVKSIVLFSLFVEHVSLFSQFLIMMSFNKHKNLFKGISNAVEATSKEEQIHGQFGIDLVNIINKENPDWLDDKAKEKLQRDCQQAYDSEMGIVDWILEKGELDFLSKEEIDMFLRDRFNKSLKSLGVEPIFDIDTNVLEKTSWFDDEVLTTKHVDFFFKRSINYSKRNKSITSADIF